MEEFELALNKSSYEYREGLISSFLGYYTALNQQLDIYQGFQSNDKKYAIIR